MDDEKRNGEAELEGDESSTHHQHVGVDQILYDFQQMRNLVRLENQVVPLPLCSKCGLPIPPGERFDPNYPLCEGCSIGVDDEE